MKQVAQGAGKFSQNPARRKLLGAGLGIVMLSAVRVHADEPSIISPAMSYGGARILRRVDPVGMPNFQADAFGPMTLFVFPVAVAVSPFDIYIADAGLSALFRYDPAADAMMAIPGVRVTQLTRITALQDGSVVVVEGNQGIPRRFSRAGRPMQIIDPRNTGSRFDDILVNPATGGYFALNRMQRRIEEVQPLGQSSAILADNLLPSLPTAMALDGRTLYVAGQDCQCIVAVDLSRRDKQVLTQELGQITAMAAGDGWLVVSDNADRELRIYRDNILRSDPGYEKLRLINPQGLSISRGVLYVADPGTRRIATFRLRP